MSEILPWHADAIAESGELPQATLAVGGEGFGTVEFAVALAYKRLAAESPANSEKISAMAKAGNHPDFLLLAREWDEKKKKRRKEIVVEQARRLISFCATTPRLGGVKIGVIADAETMHPVAANALLKTLEEPPPMVRLILVCESPRRLPPTILSRCQIIFAPTPPPAAAESWLISRGIESPKNLLALCGGAPLLALEAAKTADARAILLGFLRMERGASILSAAKAASELPPSSWVDWMQKWTADAAAFACGLAVRFYPSEADSVAAISRRASPKKWLDLSRRLAAVRRDCEHPQNLRLLAESVLYEYRRAVSG